jgi:AAA domain
MQSQITERQRKRTKKSSTLLETSTEQQLVCDHIAAGDNVVVDACAGSGKSTTILSVARQLPKKRFLQITYNAMLRKEFREKVEESDLTNIEVHTYHSLAVRYFSGEAYTDTGIRHLLSDGLLPREEMPPYDIVVLDETQDMTFLYFRFVLYLLGFICGEGRRGRPHKVQLLILGDYMQGLYEFKGADIRFLTQADKIWSGAFTKKKYLKSAIFHRCSLKTSYRITRPMAAYVNYVMLGEERLLACRDGCPVTYIRNSRTNIERIVVYHILKILQEGDLPSDIFLGASVKGANSNIRKLENVLVERGIPCHVPMLENEKIDDRVINGKVVFSTFHTVKGRQRKYVFVVGFDQSYFSYYAKNMNQEKCPNTLYVACTRATHHMFLLESNDRSTDQPLKFLKMDHHEMKVADFVDFKGNAQTIFYEKAPETKESGGGAGKTFQIHHVTPTDLIKFVSEPVLEQITPILDEIFVLESGRGDQDLEDRLITEDAITEPRTDGIGSRMCKNHEAATDTSSWEFSQEEMPTVVQFQGGLYEDVADLNGIAIPCYYWDSYLEASAGHSQTSTKNSLYEFVRTMIQELNMNEHSYLKRKFAEISPEDKSAATYLYLANMYLAVQEKLYFKISQIEAHEYDWLSSYVMEECKRRLDYHIGAEGILHHEYSLIHARADEDHIDIDRVLEDAGVCTDPETGKKKKYRFTARVDVVTESTVWEIKCTQQITIDHMLQVVVYAWLWRLVYGEGDQKEFKLFNLRNGSVYTLHASTEQLTFIITELLRGKYEKPIQMTEEEFVSGCIQLNS